MSQQAQRPWFTTFLVGNDGFPDSEVIWADASENDLARTAVRRPTRTEKASILLVGAIALGSIVLMVVALIVAVYVSRH